MRPSLFDPVSIAAESRQRDGQIGAICKALCVVRPIKQHGVGMQARIQKRGVQGVASSRQMLRKLYFGKSLVFTDIQFSHPAKTRTVFKPEPMQPIVEIGNRYCSLATRLNVSQRKGWRRLRLRFSQDARHVGLPDFRVPTGCAQQPEVCFVRSEWSDHQAHNPLFRIGKGHRPMMHRVVETHLMSSEVHSAKNCCRFQFSGRGEDNGPRNSVIRKIVDMLGAIARFIARLFGRPFHERADQRVGCWLDSIATSIAMRRAIP